ncbi:MAG: D-arabinono-1,4-lactone oxidase [Oleiphilaceae bacterium]|nr:D-arabinono-1,4-lactone oxidase [Oleiphilaceae bacterium]
MLVQRRHLLKSLIATTVAASLPASTLAALASKQYPWKNWSGNQQCVPAKRLAPRNISELQTLLREGKDKIRAVGSGHSFSALVPTEHTLLSTRRLTGLESTDADSLQATILGGTVLQDIGPALNDNGQALINMPDIDQQTLAGCIATATHGTGRQLGSLSSYVTEIELALANGDLLRCSEAINSEYFRAAQVNLGALGIVTRVTMQNRSPFKLKREARWMPFEDCVAEAQSMADNNRNFEFYYFPFTGMTLGDYLNPTEEDVHKGHELDGNSGVLDLKTARDYLGWSNKLREMILGAYMRSIEPSTNVDHSYAIYATERNVRFNEMEYHLPLESGLVALREIRTLIEKRFPEVFFPIECRFVKGEEAWLSPFYRRDSISLAIHRYFEEDFGPLFAAVEPVLRKHGGRPHWGKFNTLTAPQLASLYPQWQAFKEVRQTLDPSGRFLNDYLAGLLT